MFDIYYRNGTVQGAPCSNSPRPLTINGPAELRAGHPALSHYDEDIGYQTLRGIYSGYIIERRMSDLEGSLGEEQCRVPRAVPLKCRGSDITNPAPYISNILLRDRTSDLWGSLGKEKNG